MAPYRWQRWHGYFDAFSKIYAGAVLAGPYLPGPGRNQNINRNTWVPYCMYVFNNAMDCIIHSCEDARNETVTTFTDISWRRMSLSAIEWLSVDESDKQCVLTATHSEALWTVSEPDLTELYTDTIELVTQSLQTRQILAEPSD